MKLENKISIITGAASGIGKELATRFSNQGAVLMLADRDSESLMQFSKAIGAKAFVCDVSSEASIQELVAKTETELGPVDIFCSNAGLIEGEPSHAASATNETWQTLFDVHVMAQVYAARAVLPSMIERGGGYLINMASAAGLLSQIGDAAYSATKHASVGFSESLAISHSDDGIKVSVICPQYIATPLTGYDKKPEAPLNLGSGILSVEKACDLIIQGIDEERFMIDTHEDTKQNFRNKAENYERWISGMRKIRRKIVETVGSTQLKDMHKLF